MKWEHQQFAGETTKQPARSRCDIERKGVMSNWETSNYENGGELRARIGLQFFAEGEDGGADTSADMDGFDGNAFAAAFGYDDAGDQRTAAEEGAEDGQAGAGDQRTDGQPEGTEEQPPQEGGAPEETPPPQTAPPVELRVMDTTYTVPAELMQELQSILGTDPAAVLQKGMNYDNKAARELRMIDSYAAASGLTREQYLDRLEQAREQELLQAEIEQARQEFPDTPEAALQVIAEQRRAAAKAADRQREAEQRQAAEEGRMRVQNMVAETQRAAEIKAWDAYEGVAGVHEPENIPARVMELVQQGHSPVEAHYISENEKLQQQLEIREKETSNRQASPGSMSGAGGDVSDPFLRGFLQE